MGRRWSADAPGRADWLNTHQDYKGLPVVPAALELRTRVEAEKTAAAGLIRAEAADLRERGENYRDEFSLAGEIPLAGPDFFGNYLRATARTVLAAAGPAAAKARRADFGLAVTIRSEVPVGSGLASSAALEVAFAALLNGVFALGLDPGALAEATYKAENEELGIPCGRLDQYGSAFGQVLVLAGPPPDNVRRLEAPGLVLVVVDSGIRHSTAAIHPARQAELDRGLAALAEDRSLAAPTRAKLAGGFAGARWGELSEAELGPALDGLDDAARRRILFTLRLDRSTARALALLENPPGDRAELLAGLGREMNLQHEGLRDLYDVSLPELEELWRALRAAGARGAKLSGSGLGGALIALADDRAAGERILAGALAAGAKQGWISAVGPGVNCSGPRDRAG